MAEGDRDSNGEESSGDRNHHVHRHRVLGVPAGRDLVVVVAVSNGCCYDRTEGFDCLDVDGTTGIEDGVASCRHFLADTPVKEGNGDPALGIDSQTDCYNHRRPRNHDVVADGKPVVGGDVGLERNVLHDVGADSVVADTVDRAVETTSRQRQRSFVIDRHVVVLATTMTAITIGMVTVSTDFDHVFLFDRREMAMCCFRCYDFDWTALTGGGHWGNGTPAVVVVRKSKEQGSHDGQQFEMPHQ